jgi:hypothetical protein
VTVLKLLKLHNMETDVIGILFTKNMEKAIVVYLQGSVQESVWNCRGKSRQNS